MPLPAKISALTFDCYGTLIDWESGILAAMYPILDHHGIQFDSENILTAFARSESAVQQGEYIPYHEVLRRTYVGMARDLGFPVVDEEIDTLAASLPSWQPFHDTNECLKRLAESYRLAMISNIDEQMFVGTRSRLQVDFDLLITSQVAKAYKPHPSLFTMALAKLGAKPGEIVHVAQSIYHDIVPARAMGIPVVHVRRDSRNRSAIRATPSLKQHIEADLEVEDLRELCEKLQ